MSKSRGTFITARKYLENFPAEYLRYYFAAKLGPGIDDMDMNLDEFATRLNSEIVGKLVNIASRCAGFISADLGRQAGEGARGSAILCGIRQRRRRYRKELRQPRYGRRHPRHHGALRSRQSIRRLAQTLDAGQGSEECRGSAERLHPSLELVSRFDDLP